MLIAQSNWTNGLLDGISRTYYPSAKKKSETNYRLGLRDGLCLTCYESGMPQISGQYKNDQPDGIWKFMDQNGKIKYELTYYRGRLQNPEVIDGIMAKEFKAFDHSKGKLKDPEDFVQSPEEYIRK